MKENAALSKEKENKKSQPNEVITPAKKQVFSQALKDLQEVYGKEVPNKIK